MDLFIKTVKEHYADFDGRARRKEYWMFVLFVFLFYVAFAIVAGIFSAISSTLGGIIMGIGGLAMLGLVIPCLAIAVRRLHDIGKSGWMILVQLIPLIGGIWLLIMLCTDTQPGDNQYGPDPKAGER